ncbi:OmpH family outer membrane protein [Rikenella microfusus]|uniref:OmpH family outer membrane protein n=2 Tax=Rikenella microfusus TaxID=28139 RepID=UPI001D1E8A62|nr:OmpH family outer membrane protein [Rikenella microfusus]HJE87711.1 OmpH family outer membrane protein [Rikenella microfusus]
MNRTKLNIVSFAAAVAAGLFAVGCGSSDKGGTSAAGNAADSARTVAAAAGSDYNGKIVYVQIDSIMRGYGMAIDLQAAFASKSEKAQNELNAKGRSLEREMRDYQEKAQKGLITRFQAQDIESGLQKKQQSVLEYRDRMMQELGEEEAVMMNKISDAIMQYVKKYNAEKKYSMIISTQGANTVLIADPALNITDDLLKGLNDEYRAMADSTKAKK